MTSTTSEGSTMTEPEAAAPKRLTLSHIVEMLLSRSAQERSSVTLSRNTKGDTMIDVTVRTGEAAGIVTVADAEKHAREVYDRLRSEYPYVGAAGGTSSIALTRNAKGDTQLSVEVKAGEGTPHATLEAAESEARTVYDRTIRRYPMADGRTVAPAKGGGNGD